MADYGYNIQNITARQKALGVDIVKIDWNSPALYLAIGAVAAVAFYVMRRKKRARK